MNVYNIGLTPCKLLSLLPKIFYDLNKRIMNQGSEHRRILIFHTAFVLMIAVAFIAGAWLYFLMPMPLNLAAPEPLSFPLKLEYLERPIKIGYLLKTFSGNLPKVIVYFAFYDKHKKLLSRLTYVLSGEGDHWNYMNQTVSGVSYITYVISGEGEHWNLTNIRVSGINHITLGKEQRVVFENILKEYNEGARRINAETLKSDDIVSVTVNFQAWYNAGGGNGGDISASFYSWDKYVIN